MKKSIFFVLLILFIYLTFVSTVNADHYNSLSFWLLPWNGEIRPGGAVVIGTNPIFDSNETTIESWFKPQSYATGVGEDEGRTIIWNGDGTAGHDPYWILINQYGFLEARVDFESPYQHQVITSANPVDLNVWHHFALVISMNETNLYLDGLKQPNVVLNAGSACKGTNYLALGRSMWHWNPYEGLIDEMRIWNTARTEDEILNSMLAGKIVGSETNLISYWDFEPRIDPSILWDSTINSINGIIDGPVWFEENSPISEPVPEPSTILVLGSGLLGLAGYGRKKFFKK